MPDRFAQVPRSCDLLDLTDVHGAAGERGYLVWMMDDRKTVLVRAAPTLRDAADTARVYCRAWGAVVLSIEDPLGGLVSEAEWAPLLASVEPLRYLFTVELRSSPGNAHEHVTTLWTTPDVDAARRWRDMLPEVLRRRTLIVSDAPDGRRSSAPWTIAEPVRD